MIESSLPMMHRVLLALRVKSLDLTNPRVPLKERLNQRLPSQHILFLPLFPPRNKRKRGDIEDFGTSKAGESPAEEPAPEEEEENFNPYEEGLVSS
jgi:hypothetical protein